MRNISAIDIWNGGGYAYSQWHARKVCVGGKGCLPLEVSKWELNTAIGHFLFMFCFLNLPPALPRNEIPCTPLFAYLVIWHITSDLNCQSHQIGAPVFLTYLCSLWFLRNTAFGIFLTSMLHQFLHTSASFSNNLFIAFFQKDTLLSLVTALFLHTVQMSRWGWVLEKKTWD